MPAYIYYTSTTPSNTVDWETNWPDTPLDTWHAIRTIRTIYNDDEVQFASNGYGHGYTNEDQPLHKAIIVYFESRETLDSYLSNNSTNLITICEDSTVVQYCEDNNIVYNISIIDTTSSLLDIILSIDNDNVDNWSVADDSDLPRLS